MSDLYDKYIVIKRADAEQLPGDGRLQKSLRSILAGISLMNGGKESGYFVVKSTDPKYEAVKDFVLNDGTALTQIVDRQAKIDALEAELALAKQDIGFFRCCALSGETPTEGAEPSALPAPPEKEDEDPTPYCAGCHSMTREGCDCGPRARNN